RTVTSRGASRPTAMLCKPRGFRISNFPSLTWCRRLLTSRRPSSSISRLCISGLSPAIDCCRLWLPHLGVLCIGEHGDGTILGRHGDPVVGFGNDSVLPANRIARHRETVLRPDGEGEEAIQILEGRLKRLRERLAFAQTPSEVSSRHFTVVIALENDSSVLTQPLAPVMMI